MRTRDHARRSALLDALAAQLPDWRVGEAGERFVLASVPDEAAIIAHAVEHGVGLEGLEAHRYEPGGEGGIVLGFGALPEPALVRAIELLAGDESRSPRRSTRA